MESLWNYVNKVKGKEENKEKEVENKKERKEIFINLQKVFKQKKYEISESDFKVLDSFGIAPEYEQEIVNTFLVFNYTDIIYITGFSGSGKSVILKCIIEYFNNNNIKYIDVNTLVFPENVSILDYLIKYFSFSFEQALYYLGRAGLAEAMLFYKTYNELSEGQKLRYKIAFALATLIEKNYDFIICDEFLNSLDRLQARVIAFSISKLLRQSKKGGIFVTALDDLIEDLNPNIIIFKGFGKDIKIIRNQKFNNECSIMKNIVFEKGAIEDYEELEEFHYRGSIKGYMDVFRLVYVGEKRKVLVAVAVISPISVLHLSARFTVAKKYNISISEIPKQFRTIVRVVIHPGFRSIGLASYLLKKIVEYYKNSKDRNFRFLEIFGVMLSFSRFPEKAGFTEVKYESDSYNDFMKLYKKLIDLGFKDEYILSYEKFELYFDSLTQEERKKFFEILSEILKEKQKVRQSENRQPKSIEIRFKSKKELYEIILKLKPARYTYFYYDLDK